MKKFSAVIAGLLFFFSTVSAPLVEANYWNDRREAVQARQSKKTLYAMGPTGAGLAEALPFLDGQVSGGVEMGSLSGASLPSAHSSLTPEQVKLLPAWLHGISSSHGSITQAHFAPDAAHRPFVVHIQDVHEQREAQLNISALINDVVRTGAVSLVGLEGAVGSFDLTPYRAYPNKTGIEDVADFMVQEHMIGGGEHAGWTAEKMPTLWGVEELGIYLKNLNSFKEALPVQQRVQDRIKNWIFRLAQVKPKVFSPALKQFDDSQARYRADTLPLPEFVDALNKIVKIQESQYPSLTNFQKCMAMEKSLNFSLVEKERELLVQRLTQALSEKEIAHLVQRTLAYRSGALSHGAYYDSLQAFCETKGVSFAKFPAMAAYVKYVLAADQIKPENLLNELDAIQDQAASVLVRTPEERAIHDLGADLHSLTNLAEFRMSPRDWAIYERNRPRILDMAARMDKLAPGSDPHAGDLPKDLIPFEGFCQAALDRDKTLVDNLLAKMEESDQKAAILLAGGFHTGGMTDLLQKNKVSYVVLTPTFTEVSTDSHYLDFLINRPALEKLFTQEKITTKIPVLSAATPIPGYEGAAAISKTNTECVFSAAAAAENEEVPAPIRELSPAEMETEERRGNGFASTRVDSGNVITIAQKGPEAPVVEEGSQSVASYTSARDGGFSFTIAIGTKKNLFASFITWVKSLFQRSDRGDRSGGASSLALVPGAHGSVVALLLPLAKIFHGKDKALDFTIHFYAPIFEAAIIFAMFFNIGVPLIGLEPLGSVDLNLFKNLGAFYVLNVALGLVHFKGFKQSSTPGAGWVPKNLTLKERFWLGNRLALFQIGILIGGWVGLLAGMVGHIVLNIMSFLYGWVAGSWGTGDDSVSTSTPALGHIKKAERLLLLLAIAKTDEDIKGVQREFASNTNDSEMRIVRQLLVKRIKELQKIGMFHRTSLFLNWVKFMDAASQNPDGSYPSFNRHVETLVARVTQVYQGKLTDMAELPQVASKPLAEVLLKKISKGDPAGAARDFIILTSDRGDTASIGILDRIVPNLADPKIAEQWNVFLTTLGKESGWLDGVSRNYNRPNLNQILTETTDIGIDLDSINSQGKIQALVTRIQKVLVDHINNPPGAIVYQSFISNLNTELARLRSIQSQNPRLQVHARIFLTVAIQIHRDALAIMKSIQYGYSMPSSQFFSFPEGSRGEADSAAIAGAHKWVVGILVLLVMILKIHSDPKTAKDRTIRFYAPIVEAFLILMAFAYGAPFIGLEPLGMTLDLNSLLNLSFFYVINFLFGLSHGRGYEMTRKGESSEVDWNDRDLSWSERRRLGSRLALFHLGILVGGVLGLVLGAVGHILHNEGARRDWWPAGALGGEESSLSPEQIEASANWFLVRYAYGGANTAYVKFLRSKLGETDFAVKSKISDIITGFNGTPIQKIRGLGMMTRFFNVKNSISVTKEKVTLEEIRLYMQQKIATNPGAAARDLLIMVSKLKVDQVEMVINEISPSGNLDDDYHWNMFVYFLHILAKDFLEDFASFGLSANKAQLIGKIMLLTPQVEEIELKALEEETDDVLDQRETVNVEYLIQQIFRAQLPAAQGGIGAENKNATVYGYVSELLNKSSDWSGQAFLFKKILKDQGDDAPEILQGIVNRIPQERANEFQEFIRLTALRIVPSTKRVEGQGNNLVFLSFPVEILSFGLNSRQETTRYRNQPISLIRLLPFILGSAKSTAKNLPNDWNDMPPRQMMAWLAYATPQEQVDGMTVLRKNQQKAKFLLKSILMNASAAHANGVSYRNGSKIPDDQMHDEISQLGRFALWLGLPVDVAQDVVDETYNLGRTMTDIARDQRKKGTEGMESVLLENSPMGTDGALDFGNLAPDSKFNAIPLPLTRDPNGQVTWLSHVNEETRKTTLEKISSEIAKKEGGMATTVIPLDPSLTENDVESFLSNNGINTSPNLHILTGDTPGLFMDDGSINVPAVSIEMGFKLNVLTPERTEEWYNYIRPVIYTTDPAALYVGEYWQVVQILLLVGGEYKSFDLNNYDNKVERYFKIQA